MTASLKYVVEHLPIDDIFVVGDRRPVNGDAVKSIAASIKSIGLQTPITVRGDDTIPDPDTGEIMGGFALISGRHRLEAYRLNGETDIPAIVRDCDEIDAELWEIDENLCRAELTEAQEAEHLARRKELWAKREERNQVGKVCPPETGYKKPPPQSEGFATETAKATGQSKRSINQKVERGEKIAPDVLKDITGTKWDRGTNLDILKKLTHAEQRQALFRVKNGASATLQEAYDFIRGEESAPKPKPFKKPAEPLNDIEARDQWLASGMAWWNRGSQEWREEFLSRIDRPVIDHRYGPEVADERPFVRRAS